jgi:hypothetical protein
MYCREEQLRCGLDLENVITDLEEGARMEGIGMEAIQLSHLFTGVGAVSYWGSVRIVGI